MTDIHTLDLRPSTPEQLAQLHELETARLARDARSTGRPPGGRLSITCPIRRVKAVFDDWFTTPIDEGVGWRGHLLESYALAVLLDGHTYEVQPLVEWSHGLSAWDAIVTAAPAASPFAVDIPIDWKSTTGNPTPSAANRAQAEIMLVADGAIPGAIVHHWMLSVSDWKAHGPFPHMLTTEAHAFRTAELMGTGAAIDYLHDLEEATGKPATKTTEWDDAEWWSELGLECSCGGCIPYVERDASNAIERIWYRYEMAQATESEGRHLKDAMRTRLIEAAELQLRDVPDGEKAVITIWSGDEGTITRSASGTWTIRKKTRKSADAAA